jgi:hypothetical protein
MSSPTRRLAQARSPQVRLAPRPPQLPQPQPWQQLMQRMRFGGPHTGLEGLHLELARAVGQQQRLALVQRQAELQERLLQVQLQARQQQKKIQQQQETPAGPGSGALMRKATPMAEMVPLHWGPQAPQQLQPQPPLPAQQGTRAPGLPVQLQQHQVGRPVEDHNQRLGGAFALPDATREWLPQQKPDWQQPAAQQQKQQQPQVQQQRQQQPKKEQPLSQQQQQQQPGEGVHTRQEQLALQQQVLQELLRLQKELQAQLKQLEEQLTLLRNLQDKDALNAGATIGLGAQQGVLASTPVLPPPQADWRGPEPGRQPSKKEDEAQETPRGAPPPPEALSAPPHAPRLSPEEVEEVENERPFSPAPAPAPTPAPKPLAPAAGAQPDLRPSVVLPPSRIKPLLQGQEPPGARSGPPRVCRFKDTRLPGTTYTRPYGLSMVQGDALTPLAIFDIPEGFDLRNATGIARSVVQAGALVCLISSGVDPGAPTLLGATLTGCQQEHPLNPGGCPFAWDQDVTGAGTHLASIVAGVAPTPGGAKQLGVLPGAEVYSVRVWERSPAWKGTGGDGPFSRDRLTAYTACEGRLRGLAASNKHASNYRMVRAWAGGSHFTHTPRVLGWQQERQDIGVGGRRMDNGTWDRRHWLRTWQSHSLAFLLLPLPTVSPICYTTVNSSPLTRPFHLLPGCADRPAGGVALGTRARQARPYPIPRRGWVARRCSRLRR